MLQPYKFYNIGTRRVKPEEGCPLGFLLQVPVGKAHDDVTRIDHLEQWWRHEDLTIETIAISFSHFHSFYLFFLSTKLYFFLFYLSVCLSIYLCIYLRISLSIQLTFYLSIYLSMYPAIYLSVFLSVFLTAYLPVCLSVCLTNYPAIFLSVCLSIYLSIRPVRPSVQLF